MVSIPDKLEILIYPHAGLRIKAAPVQAVTAEIKNLMDRMFHVMYENQGMGLAATQVNIPYRLFVMGIPIEHLAQEEQQSQGYQQTKYYMINPEITWKSKEQVSMAEGCLSFPGIRGDVTRSQQVEVCYLDENGMQKNIKFQGYIARCIQHELDHLDGIVYIDYFSSLKQKILLRKMRKYLQSNASETDV